MQDTVQDTSDQVTGYPDTDQLVIAEEGLKRQEDLLQEAEVLPQEEAEDIPEVEMKIVFDSRSFLITSSSKSFDVNAWH
ncbi:hypothetical protein Anas_08261 [Armadillidium nasatum]|uniref:Uncharacterized protein n=1 Tax=Armadillidium nasatum TaxID=96803 RepID=A0A5N5STA3_9CRUS|nr:hypothetical protein Anas_08261 [Armadillidium nasatum]